MRIGIVAEGPSDQQLLRAIIQAVRPDAETQFLQPEQILGSRGSGWRGVRNWCEELGGDLEMIMEADPKRPLDHLLIHVDCSMAHNVGANRPCPPAMASATALEAVVLEDWLGLTTRPEWLQIVTPSGSSDTWLAAVLAPQEHEGDIECVPQSRIEGALVAARLFRKKQGQVKKSTRQYAALAKEVAQEIALLRERCTLADAFCRELP
jgi:hypothetical protein